MAFEILRSSLGDAHPQTRRLAMAYGDFLTRYARLMPGPMRERARMIAESFGTREAPMILPASERTIQWAPH